MSASRGVSNSYKAQKIAEVVRGWINYFKIGSILASNLKTRYGY